VDILDLGPKTSARLQARSFVGFNELKIDVRGDYYAESTDLNTGEQQQTLPSQVVGQVRYTTPLSDAVRGWVLVGGRYYDAAEGFQGLLLDRALSGEERNILDLGLGSMIRLGGGLRIQGRGIYSLGDLSGLEVGLGLTLSL